MNQRFDLVPGTEIKILLTQLEGKRIIAVKLKWKKNAGYTLDISPVYEKEKKRIGPQLRRFNLN